MPSSTMLVNAVAPQLLPYGKKWLFVVADVAFGTDAAARFSKILVANGGTVVATSLHKRGLDDFTGWAQQNLANTTANVIVFCNYGPDTKKAVRAAVDLGLNRKSKFGGILCGNDVVNDMPVDDIVGSYWGYVWGADAGGHTTGDLNGVLRRAIEDFNWRHYLGYMSAKNLINAMLEAGTTQTDRLVRAMEGMEYDAGKFQPGVFRKCDHQAVQQTYAATVIPRSKRKTNEDYMAITNSVNGEYSAEACSAPGNVEAAKVFSGERFADRPGYRAKDLRA